MYLRRGMIDLLLDTGTVSNLVPEDQHAVVQDIRNETASLVGVGGARVLASETGVSSWGIWKISYRPG